MATAFLVEEEFRWVVEVNCPRCGHKHTENYHTKTKYTETETKEFTCFKCQLIFKELICYNRNAKKAKK